MCPDGVQYRVDEEVDQPADAVQQVMAEARLEPVMQGAVTVPEATAATFAAWEPVGRTEPDPVEEAHWER